MNRRIACVVAAAALTCALAGCSSDGGDSSSAASTSAATSKSQSGGARLTGNRPTTAESTTSSEDPSATTTTAAGDIPALFPDDWPFPPDMQITETRDEAVTALVAGTLPGADDAIQTFYDSRLPGLGWTLNESTSSGCAHVYERDGFSASIVCAGDQGEGAPSFQITLQGGE